MGRLIWCCVAVALGVQAQAQTPTVTGVAAGPGSIGYVFGSNFGTVENTIVTVGGQNAQVLAVSSNHIRALFPTKLQAGITTLTVTVDGTASETVTVLVSANPLGQVQFGRGTVSAGAPGTFPPSPVVKAPATLVPPAASPEAAATGGTGIIYTCDPTITALWPTVCDTLNTTIAGLYSSTFTNANASIYVTLGSGGCCGGNSGWSYNWFSYSSFRNALIAKADDTNDITADADSVPGVNPFGSDTVGIVGALQRAVGLSTTSCLPTATPPCYDGTITIQGSMGWYFRTGVISGNQYDFFTIVQHETDEILGTPSCAVYGSCSGFVFPPDYFRYHSNGELAGLAAGTNDPCSSSDSTNACFSLDGIHMLQQYNNINTEGDAGDWAYNCSAPLVQDNAICAGTAGVDISPAAEILVLDVIGYTLLTPTVSGGVTNVTSSTPNGTDGVGASISIQISFSEPVTVTGTPLLGLNSGGTASYSSGSGTSTLTFTYVVAAGQSTTLLDCWSTGALTLNGGSIEGPGGIAESLTLPRPGVTGSLGANTDIGIDTSPTPITIRTNPSGLQFSVDGGAAQIAPLTLTLTQGSHTIAVATAQVGATCSGYGYSAIATIHHAYVAADASNYTATIVGTWPALATVGNGGQVTNANGYDICFANSANTATLSWELESYNGATGAIVAHVMVGSITSTADTMFSIYYGNSSISTFQGGSAGAWDTSTYPYAGVWHLGNGMVLNGTDSSANANDLVNYGATPKSGEIDGAAAFASSAYMTASPSSSLDSSGAISFSFWENPSSIGNPVLTSRTSCNAGNWQIYDGVSGNGLYFNFWSGSSGPQAFTNTKLSLGVWSHVVVTYDGSNARFYVNGSLTNTVSMSGTRNSNPNTFNVGTDSCGGFLQGSLDEVRIAQGAWPSTLIRTMYNNQSAPSTFVTVSGMTPVNPSSPPAGAQYVFTGWSDGGAASHSIMVGASEATYTASFSSPLSVPTLVLRDTVGSIRSSTYPSSTLSNSGGVFASDPSAAQYLNGNTFVTARDTYDSIWANVYNPITSTWSGWQFGGGIIQGVPSIAVDTTGTGWIASRDTWNSFWLVSYTTGSGFGSWTPLLGIFSTDPVVTACGDGSIYLIGKDNYNSLWSGHYIPGTGFQGWQFGGGIIAGKPSATCGSDNAVYVVGEDDYNSNWMARVSSNTWTGWFFGGAITSVTPRIAALGNGSEAVVILDSTDVVWSTTFTEGTGNGWQPWVQVGGILADVAPAGVGGQLYFAGEAPNGDLWWWQQTGSQWTWIGNNGVAAGPLAAAPK